jgi:hypothetical protein
VTDNPMDPSLFLAILSMDSYNRGYDQGIKLNTDDEDSSVNEVGRQIGDATVIMQSDPNPGSAEVDDGFYAIAYQWGTQRIISYRGTDNYNLLDGSNDVLNGWIIGGGWQWAQAPLSIQFYKDVVGVDAAGNFIGDPLSNNIVVTGHSLGGGLAGYVASLYGREAIIFVNMPLDIASRITQLLALAY